MAKRGTLRSHSVHLRLIKGPFKKNEAEMRSGTLRKDSHVPAVVKKKK